MHNYAGRTAGAFLPGFVASLSGSGHAGDCMTWAVAAAVFALIWPPMLWRWRRLHPVALARFNGANAVKGPSGYSTTARSVSVPAEPSLATPLLSPAAS